MKFEAFLLLATVVSRSTQLTLNECSGNLRRPEITDISVSCGTSSIDLAVQICPVIYTGYNESLLILNHMLEPACRGTLDDTVDPPVARFNFPLNMTNACGSVFRTTSAAGTGVFSDFSNIQTVNISGIIQSSDPTTGTVTYNAELKYYYSCAYPLEYLINNTQVDVSASSIAVRDNNGSFISTLSLELFSDADFTQSMVMPRQGLELRSTVYVEVKATNLTGQYNVLLDRCYASISPLPTNSTFFNLFVPCSQDQFTTMVLNGQSQSARFHFPAFRFIEQQNETVSTYYLHCITRLCEISTCSTFMQCNNRRRRDTRDGTGSADVITDMHTITSPEIVTKTETVGSKEEIAGGNQGDSSAVGLSVGVGVLAFACLVALCVAVVFYNRLKH
ncbi:zona pellucida-like domain-containing protein 1 [Gadus chalcogrammus]|uniref:zona pellucida-like domain-containing protein 1 n=1 Tax=Gadus chalcogrammus TaxID=1042646 RepID=UPI0024C4BD8D|nr:zona pellucida-like domain-containing protein 1 [Gadus chalcogrammus]